MSVKLLHISRAENFPCIYCLDRYLGSRCAIILDLSYIFWKCVAHPRYHMKLHQVPQTRGKLMDTLDAVSTTPDKSESRRPTNNISLTSDLTRKALDGTSHLVYLT